jgi:hypothetical protein
MEHVSRWIEAANENVILGSLALVLHRVSVGRRGWL